MLPPTASELVEQQLAAVREAHTRIASLVNMQRVGATAPASVD
jgi:hypothetical protein